MSSALSYMEGSHSSAALVSYMNETALDLGSPPSSVGMSCYVCRPVSVLTLTWLAQLGSASTRGG